MRHVNAHPNVQAWKTIASGAMSIVRARLVEEDTEDEVIAEARHSVKGGHPDDERKQIVDESVERLVHEELPRQMGNRFEPIVDEQLRAPRQTTMRTNNKGTQRRLKSRKRRGVHQNARVLARRLRAGTRPSPAAS